jgi:hypothetical protein
LAAAAIAPATAAAGHWAMSQEARRQAPDVTIDTSGGNGYGSHQCHAFASYAEICHTITNQDWPIANGIY